MTDWPTVFEKFSAAQGADQDADSNGIHFLGSHHTWGALALRGRELSGFYHSLGLKTGDVVAIWLPTCTELVVAHLGVMAGGMTTLPMNRDYPLKDVLFLLQDSAAKAIITDNEGAAQLAGTDCANLPDLAHRISVDETPPAGALAFPAKGVFSPAEVVPPPQGAESPAIILYTSGTTGKPKGAPLSHRNIVANLTGVTTAWEITQKDRLLLVLPLFHAHGLVLGLHGAMFTGADVVLKAGFDPTEVLETISHARCTVFMAVPTLYFRLLQSPLLSKEALKNMRLFTSGSAPLDAKVWEAFHEQTGFGIVERYGLSETLFNTTNPLHGPCLPGTVGLPFPGVEVKIMKTESGPDEKENLCPPGTEGQIWVRGPHVFSGYLNRPKATAEVFRGDWFATGDLGRIREKDGYLEILGRLKELIITGGYNVYPREVENVLMALPGVAECAVIGKPSAEWGETVHAVVVPSDPPPKPETLMAEAAKNLPPYKRPRSVTFLPALPRNAMGKVQKNLL